MKPVSVKFSCFGPYMDQQFINFQGLEKNGLFLISGETGAGKTTILDAMCYALYCESSGGQRGDIEGMRCKLAEKNDETEVEFIFDSDGRRYKFTRAMKYKTKNLHKYHKCFLWNGVEWELITDKEKQVNAEAERLVGLTSSQFRQVIILPQGKFEEFLTSESKKKEEILVTLFNVQQWSRITEELSRRVNKRAEALNSEKAFITAKLQNHRCDDLEALTQKGQDLENSLEQTGLLAQQAERAVAAARALYDAAKLDNEAFAELKRRQDKYETLMKQSESMDQEAAFLLSADRAEGLRSQYEDFHTARREKIRAEDALETSEKNLKDAEAELKQAGNKLDDHRAQHAENEGRRKQLLRLENARKVYDSLTGLRTAVSDSQAAFNTADFNAREREKELNDRDQELAEAFADQDRAKEAYDRAQIIYRQGIGGVLAEALETGKPCPVCGSLTHPVPARKTDDHVSEAQLDKLNKAMNKSNKAVSNAVKARGEAESARNAAQSARNAAAQQLAIARNDCRNAEEQKIPGIETTKQLEAAIGTLAQTIETYENNGKTLLNAQTEAEGGRKAAELAVSAAREALTAAQTSFASRLAVWEEALQKSGFGTEQAFLDAYLEPEEKRRRNDVVVTYRADVKNAREALDEQKALVMGKTVQDIALLQQGLNEAQEQSKELSKKKILLKADLETLRADEKTLTVRIEAYRTAMVKLEADQVFVRRLVGSHGVGLQRYVLGVMMNSITVQANRLLEKVYGGRYRLYRTDETSGRVQKGGLELEVYDSHNNQRRSVRTLSGGEKFLVALSLAIGLSTVVQAQGEGIRLEAMFIDEGFGSLDREAINDALEILQGIQRSAGVVGIISHVEALAETIPTRIEISKGRRGSSCRIVNG